MKIFGERQPLPCDRPESANPFQPWRRSNGLTRLINKAGPKAALDLSLAAPAKNDNADGQESSRSGFVRQQVGKRRLIRIRVQSSPHLAEHLLRGPSMLGLRRMFNQQLMDRRFFSDEVASLRTGCSLARRSPPILPKFLQTYQASEQCKLCIGIPKCLIPSK